MLIKIKLCYLINIIVISLAAKIKKLLTIVFNVKIDAK
jgi:hypothetical protein